MCRPKRTCELHMPIVPSGRTNAVAFPERLTPLELTVLFLANTSPPPLQSLRVSTSAFKPLTYNLFSLSWKSLDISQMKFNSRLLVPLLMTRQPSNSCSRTHKTGPRHGRKNEEKKMPYDKVLLIQQNPITFLTDTTPRAKTLPVFFPPR